MSENDRDFWSRLGLSDPFTSKAGLARVREAMKGAPAVLEAAPPEIGGTVDLAIPAGGHTIPARLYLPENAPETGPLCVFFHGGGYALGGLDSHDRVCRRLCAMSGVRLLAIDYRLAPEHAFPAAYDDSLAAFDWAAGEGAAELGADPSRLAVAGDSAGGGLAAAVAQARRAQIRFQLLIYPLLQLAEVRKDKLKAFEGHILSAKTLEWIRDKYVADPALVRDPRCSPLFCDDLHGLPPAYIAAAELDPLLAEGRAYADKLAAFGVPVDYHLGRKLPHGYFNMTRTLPVAKRLIDKVGEKLGAALR
ncbi:MULTISPECIES: alpha/beta hydrolase [Hyphobacterium]|uniref:Alpha/beta hydrolase n=1 Tax=Hyphobacterium vulgare TaxID=1736751 RepID=A0ABV6ZY32_9PROT